MQYLWWKIALWSTEKNENIFILISLKRYFSYPENQYLTY